MEISITILIQLLSASVCNKAQSILTLTTLATANNISNRIQNKVIALAPHYNSIDNIPLTIEGIITETEIENILLTEA